MCVIIVRLKNSVEIKIFVFLFEFEKEMEMVFLVYYSIYLVNIDENNE